MWSDCIQNSLVLLSLNLKTWRMSSNLLMDIVASYSGFSGFEKGWRSSLRANGHPYLMPNCVCGCPPAVGLLFIRRLVAGFALCGSTSCAASLRRAAHRMTGLGQSLREPQSLMIGGKPWGNIPGVTLRESVSEWC